MIDSSVLPQGGVIAGILHNTAAGEETDATPAKAAKAPAKKAPAKKTAAKKGAAKKAAPKKAAAKKASGAGPATDE